MMAARKAPPFTIRRVYDDSDDTGSYRVLVDRLWPRGIAKVDVAVDEWVKDVAPSTGLRRWYGHDPAKFDEFARRYRAELSSPPASDAVERLARVARTQPVTLLTSTRDVDHSGARVLHDHLTRASARRAAQQGGTAAPRRPAG